MWGWVAVNYLMDGFGHSSHSKTTSSEGTLLPLEPLADPPPDSSQDSVTPVDVNHHLPTFGFLDMGGASTQLAFSPTPEELSKSAYPEEELGHVKLRLLSGEDVEWPVFVASWLGYGTNRARERYVDQLVVKWRESHSQDTALDLTRPIEDPCLPKDLRLPSSDPSRHPDLMGSGQFSKCLLELTPLLEHSTPCPSSHCLFAGRPTPYIDFERQDQRGFIGVSEYWYTAQQVLGLGGIWDWGEWEQGMGDFCQRDWTSIEEQVEKEKGWLGAKVSQTLAMWNRANIQVELSRLQMQCFKGAWISNVLHEGIGIPRLVDAGGNDTLTGGDLGDTNTEAERRAREKGLLETKKKHHFQSMDEVDQTAISWTLGKMVIEASKAVQPRSPAVEGAWLDRLHLNDVEHHLKHLGIQTIWVYGFFAFAFALCLLTQIRRRFRLFGYNPHHRRGRKPSISQGAPISPTSTGWCWPLSNSSDSSSSGYSSLEEGVDITPVKISRPKMGRIRIWTRRLSSYLRRQGPSLPFSASRKSNRHVSMPLTNSYPYRSSNEGYPSQPGSPTRPNSFFIPASSSQNIVASSNRPPTRPSSTTPDNGRPSSSTSMSGLTSPPRSKAVRPFPTRQMSTAHIGGGGTGGDSGWNDPPSALFQQSFSDVGPSGSGNLGPNGSVHGSGSGLGSSISRKSSRVNLSEMGLAQRSSRAGTPFE
jgi:Golgi apyrase